MTLGAADRQFLQEHSHVTLFGRDATGHPIGYPMRVVSVVGDRVHFTTYRKSAKVAHFARDGRAAVLAFETDGGGVRWVSVAGPAVVWSPNEAELDGVYPRARVDSELRVPAGMSAFVRRRILEGKRIMLSVDVATVTRGERPMETS